MLRFRIAAPTMATLLLAVTVAVASKKPRGTISDPAEFSRIQSYCIDASDLAGEEALDVKDFVSTERAPKKLLSKLPWTYVSDCSQGNPDVVVRMKFERFAPMDNKAPAEGELFTFRAYLRIWQGGSSQPLYEVEAAPSNNSMTGSGQQANDPPAVQRRAAIYSAFWMLVDDVQRVSQAGSKR
jgi:hypothetical protein